jgi:predicted transcriptional regulator
MADEREEGQRASRQGEGAAARVTVNLREADSARLEELAERTKLSKNDVIRKALATEAFIQRTLGENRKILVEDAKGNVREVEFVT